ncbi:MAG: PLP-dependent aminotransferase family protein [Parvibaculaceae bacterium]
MNVLADHSRSPSYRFASRARVNEARLPDLPADLIDFSGGFAFPDCLPDITREATAAAAEFRTETMQYSDVLGIGELRELIALQARQDGVRCSPENVMIVNGAKHGLDLACRVFLEPGDRVIVTAPTYMTALGILRSHEAAFLSVGQDEAGIRTDDLETQLLAIEAAGEALPKLMFDVPDFHNPTGITTSAERRRKLVDLAERFGFVIVEDDPYRRIRFEGEAVPPIKSFDAKGVVIALGTASKIVAPGLRVGWVIATAEILRRMAGQKADGGTSPFNQRIFIELLRGNQIGHHIDELTAELRRHRDAMVSALRDLIPDCRIRVPQGGYFLWVGLPPDVDADLLAGFGAQHGVKTYPGRLCFPDEPRENALRLCYSFSDPARIGEGVRRLAAAHHTIRSRALDDRAKASALEAASGLATY